MEHCLDRRFIGMELSDHSSKGRGDLPQAERRMRVAFMLLFATVVLTNTLVGALGEAWPEVARLRGGVIRPSPGR